MTQPFQFPNGQLAYNADDLIALCQQFPDDGTNYLVREDLEKWLAYIGKNEIAQCATSARQTGFTDRQKLEDFLHKCHSLSSPQIPEVATMEKMVSEKETKEKISQSVVIENKINTPLETIQPLKIIKKTSESKSLTEKPKLEFPAKTKIKIPTTSSNIREEKPSFFQLVAGLVINVLYRDKN